MWDSQQLIGRWASPFTLRPRIALNIKSIEYEFIGEDFDSKSELLLKSNPVHKRYPVLLHGDQPLCESYIIVEYIDEVWRSGPSILPSDPSDRAIARFWAAYIDEKLLPSMRGMAMAPKEEDNNSAAKIVEEVFALLEEAFVKCSKGKDFFGGDRIGFLDIAFGSFLAWLKVTEKLSNIQLIDESKTPNLYKWAERFCSDPCVKDVIPDTDELTEFAKAMFARSVASQS